MAKDLSEGEFSPARIKFPKRKTYKRVVIAIDFNYVQHLKGDVIMDQSKAADDIERYIKRRLKRCGINVHDYQLARTHG